MPIAHCPKCNKNVTTTREDIDAGLAIFLFCCTGGIGLLVYLIIYFQKPEDHCIFCSSQTVLIDQDPIASIPQNSLPFEKDKPSLELNDNSSNRFCPFCGASFNIGQKFCENCGGNISDIQKK